MHKYLCARTQYARNSEVKRYCVHTQEACTCVSSLIVSASLTKMHKCIMHFISYKRLINCVYTTRMRPKRIVL